MKLKYGDKVKFKHPPYTETTVINYFEFDTNAKFTNKKDYLVARITECSCVEIIEDQWVLL